MTCEELQDDLPAFALGIAEEPAASEIASHLARRCPHCVAAVRKEMTTVAAMSGAVEQSDPPGRLRRRVVGMVAPEPKRAFAWLPWSAAAVMALALAVIVMRPQAPAPDIAGIDRTRLDQLVSVLNDPEAKDVAFGVPSARGRVIAGPKGVVLVAANMPKLDAGRTFELWLIPQAGNPVPAGTFDSAPDSSALYFYKGSATGAAAVAVTVEPQGGSALPTTKPFIVSKL